MLIKPFNELLTTCLASADALLTATLSKAGERDRACAEIARMLKPCGRAVIGDYVPTGSYAAVFQRAGLTVRPSRRHFAVALGPLWMVVAKKPTA